MINQLTKIEQGTLMLMQGLLGNPDCDLTIAEMIKLATNTTVLSLKGAKKVEDEEETIKLKIV